MDSPDDPDPKPGSLRPIPVAPLAGDEPFTHIDATVADFWRWAFSDLLENTTRGIVAEFLVSHALGAIATLRKSWQNYDVLTPSGVRVEVKASGYLQSWPQATVSRIGFGKLSGLAWDENTGEFGDQRSVRADVFVFAVQTCTDHELYDALDIDQWEFYVVPAAAIRGVGHRSVGIGFVREHAAAGPIALGQVAGAIETAASLRTSLG